MKRALYLYAIEYGMIKFFVSIASIRRLSVWAFCKQHAGEDRWGDFQGFIATYRVSVVDPLRCEPSGSDEAAVSRAWIKIWPEKNGRMGRKEVPRGDMSFFRLSRPTFSGKFRRVVRSGNAGRRRGCWWRRGRGRSGEGYRWGELRRIIGMPQIFLPGFHPPAGSGRLSWRNVNTLLRRRPAGTLDYPMFGQRARTIGRFKATLNERV